MFRARDVMQLPVIKFTPETDLAKAIDVMLAQQISGVPVVSKTGELIGMFSEVDQLAHFASGIKGHSVGDYMTTAVVSVDVDASLNEVLSAFRTYAMHRLPVTCKNVVVGVIGCRDLLRFLRETESDPETLARLREELPTEAEPSIS